MIAFVPTLVLALILSVVLLSGEDCHAFVIPASTSTSTSTITCSGAKTSLSRQSWCSTLQTLSSSSSFRLYSTPGDDSSTPDAEGADLAAQFFQMAQAKGVSIDENDLLDDDDDDDEDLDDASEYYVENNNNDDDDDDVEPNIPQGAIDAFVGYDSSDVGANPTVDITNDQLYSEVKERVLDTAGGFVEMTRGASDDDDDSEGGDFGDGVRPYVPPMTVPDSELTAGEVVLLVLTALKNNDNPSFNKGVEILFGYSSPGSQIKNEEGLTPAEYGQFLKETEYKALFEHLDVTIEKGEYSFDGKKGFFTARLQTGTAAGDSIAVNFILSVQGADDDSVWLIDSILIRPQSMRRRRRK